MVYEFKYSTNQNGSTDIDLGTSNVYCLAISVQADSYAYSMLFVSEGEYIYIQDRDF
jgi:hypothetical protein